MKKGFWGCGDCGAAVKAHRNLDFDGIGNRLIPAGDFFLEKKQKRARCSGLPSRFILCRTCRAKAACLGGVSVCIPYAAGAAHASRNVRQIGTRLWPCACAQWAAPRGVIMRYGQQMRWLEGVWQTRKAPCDSRSFPCAQRTAPSRAAGNPQEAAASLFLTTQKAAPKKGRPFPSWFSDPRASWAR